MQKAAQPNTALAFMNTCIWKQEEQIIMLITLTNPTQNFWKNNEIPSWRFGKVEPRSDRRPQRVNNANHENHR